MDFTTLVAQAPATDGGSSPIGMFVMFGAIIAIFYFMIIRPQQKRMKEHQALIGAVKRGDKVVLTGGLYGVVHEVEEKTVLVEVAKNTVLKYEKGAIQSVIRE
ncbi:MAG: preprotein translocase subunit YajC [Bacteroidetes bacterium]|nr:preprotein translocase subunit YajC [Bacteroidota bacterium]HVZ40882.1 preprotein translocase subunit YajC [Candidatus Kapabacteria bacterium]